MIFCMKINIKVCYKLTISFLLFIARYAKSTLKSKFVIFLQYLKKEDFLQADKHQTFLQIEHQSFLYIDAIIFDLHGQACLKFLK